jgi:hypothetical protein
MAYGASPIKRTRRSRAEIEALDDTLCEIVFEFEPVTVRQVFYQAVNRRLVPKDGSCRAGRGRTGLARLGLREGTPDQLPAQLEGSSSASPTPLASHCRW